MCAVKYFVVHGECSLIGVFVLLFFPLFSSCDVHYHLSTTTPPHHHHHYSCCEGIFTKTDGYSAEYQPTLCAMYHTQWVQSTRYVKRKHIIHIAGVFFNWANDMAKTVLAWFSTTQMTQKESDDFPFAGILYEIKQNVDSFILFFV